MQRGTLGSRHLDTLISISNLGSLLQAKGDFAAAEPLLCEALEGRRETLGSRHPDTLLSMHNLGRLLQVKDDLAAAEACALLGEKRSRCSAKRWRGRARRGVRCTALSVSNLDLLLQKMGDLAVAESFVEVD